jgi:effector-binding domain-containing protein
MAILIIKRYKDISKQYQSILYWSEVNNLNVFLEASELYHKVGTGNSVFGVTFIMNTVL